MQKRLVKLKKRRAKKKKNAKNEKLFSSQDYFVETKKTVAEEINREPADALQVKIECLSTPYPAWRRVLLPGNISLNYFVHVLIAAMGWDNNHLSSISIGGTEYLTSGYGVDFSSYTILPHTKNLDATQYTAIDELKKSNEIFMNYDFGDCWEHKITVEKILPAERVQDSELFTCLDGAGACPPDDCGGSDGVENIVYLMEHPDENKEEYDDIMTWLGEQFDKSKFSKDEVTLRLRDFA